MGTEDLGEEKMDEMIFYASDGSWLGKRKFVRIRKRGNKTQLTYKTNKAQTIDSAREIEFEISDMDKCKDFLTAVGLMSVRISEKYRHTFKLGDVVIDIDTWPKIPTYVEVEGPSVESLKELCSKLDFDWEQRFDGDAREVFRHYGHDLDKISVITFNEQQ